MTSPKNATSTRGNGRSYLWPPTGETFARPKSHYRANGELGRRASVDHVTRPDVDKLARAALDAITNIWIDDDSQVVRLRASKVWADQNWTRISMRQVQR